MIDVLKIFENLLENIIGRILFSKVAVMQVVTFLTEGIHHKYFPGYLPECNSWSYIFHKFI